MAKMERRLKWFNLKGKRIVLLWWLLPFLTNQKEKCLLLHFPKLLWLFNRNYLIGSFCYISRSEGWKWKLIFIWLTKLNFTNCKRTEHFKSVTDSRVGYKVIKIRLLILHFICTQIVHRCRRGTYNYEKFCNIFWSQHVV